MNSYLKAYLKVMALAASLVIFPVSATSTSTSTPALWNEEHAQVVKSALALLDDPQIRAARQDVIALYQTALPYTLADGRSTMEAAVDKLLFGILLTSSVADPANPPIVWSQTLPYRVGDLSVPSGVYAGDTPDRLYRTIVVDPRYRYKIYGKSTGEEPVDFTIEALAGPGYWGLPPLNVLRKTDMEVADDGSFVVTLDATPADGRPNHLQLPPQSILLLIRDTIPEWEKQRAYHLSIEGLDKGNTRSHEEIVKHSIQQFKQAAEISMAFYKDIWSREVNQFDAFVRWSGDIAPSWGIVAINRFNLDDDEAIVVTVDTLAAGYFGIQIDDLWLNSVEHVTKTSTLNPAQATANADGSFTFIVAKKDPGYINWVDTAGFQAGYLIGRWDAMDTAEPAKGIDAVRSIKTVKLSELASVLPVDFKQVTAEERKAYLEKRREYYQHRMSKG